MSITRDIPSADPRASYVSHKSEIFAAIERVLEGGSYILGAEVLAFEAEFAAYIGSEFAVGTGSGTDALVLALRACGIGPGDSVVTVSHTATATVAAIELAGATPVLVDVFDSDFTMDVNRLESELRSRRAQPIRAILPVHLYGHPADMAAILLLARRFECAVIEDCAQAHGASIAGRQVGTWGDVAAFSFYPTKNLGGLGDGGALTTNDSAIADRALRLRQYGWRERYVSEMPGLNSRLDELQAAILRVKLPHLERENLRRREIADHYDRNLQSATVTLPSTRPSVQHAYHQYVLRCNQRDGLRTYLETQGIGSNVLYPIPVHLQPAYRGRIASDDHDLHTSERVCTEILGLPIYPELSNSDVEEISGSVRAWAPASSLG